MAPVASVSGHVCAGTGLPILLASFNNTLRWVFYPLLHIGALKPAEDGALSQGHVVSGWQKPGHETDLPVLDLNDLFASSEVLFVIGTLDSDQSRALPWAARVAISWLWSWPDPLSSHFSPTKPAAGCESSFTSWELSRAILGTF